MSAERPPGDRRVPHGSRRCGRRRLVRHQAARQKRCAAPHAIFAASYFCKRPAALRAVQAFAALLWIVYGAMIHAVPVVVANVIVAAVAVLSSLAPRFSRSGQESR